MKTHFIFTGLEFIKCFGGTTSFSAWKKRRILNYFPIRVAKLKSSVIGKSFKMSKGSRLLIIVRICFAIKLFCQIVRTLRRMTYKKRLKKQNVRCDVFYLARTHFALWDISPHAIRTHMCVLPDFPPHPHSHIKSTFVLM